MTYTMKRPTTKSYAGRQLDIEVLKHVDKMLRKQRVHPDIAFDHDSNGDESDMATRIVSGIEKTVQRYAKLFLTDIGSVKTDPGIGNEVLRKVLSGQVSNLSYFDHLCSIANVHSFLAMKREDDDTDTFGDIPDDERITSSRIVDLSLDYATQTARVHVFITTAAGDTFTFIIPVSAGITQ